MRESESVLKQEFGCFNIVLQFAKPCTRPSHWLASLQIDMKSLVKATVYVPSLSTLTLPLLTNYACNFEAQPSEKLTDSCLLSKRQVAYISLRLGVLNNISFENRVPISCHFVTNNMVNHGVDNHSRWSGGTQVLVNRGSVA
jgi:hypothetical protein